MQKVKQWTNKEEQFLIEHYATHSNKKLSEMMNRSVPSIYNRAQLLGLKTEPNQYALYKGDELLHIGTVEEIAKAEGLSEKTIRHYKNPSYKKRAGNSKNYKELVAIDD